MSNIPSNLKYTETHEWVREESDGTVSIGISDYAQNLLGDLVFVELPEVDDELDAGDECAVVESVKAASDVYAPLSGTVTKINEALEGAPETINESAYEEGWMLRLTVADAGELETLMDAEHYAEYCANQDH